MFFGKLFLDKYQQLLYENNICSLLSFNMLDNDKYQQLLYENWVNEAYYVVHTYDKYQQILYKKRLVIVIFL